MLLRGDVSLSLATAVACWHLRRAVLSILEPGHWTLYDPLGDENNNVGNEYPYSKVEVRRLLPTATWTFSRLEVEYTP